MLDKGRNLLEADGTRIPAVWKSRRNGWASARVQLWLSRACVLDRQLAVEEPLAILAHTLWFVFWG